ncbi:MAG: peptidylprolyl isomerase [Vogesella sp.]|jgi:peptidyl-prolyl cis-trans isomerase C|uniref:peptidylprolyl isomerase n=1 Tax=Vogesella sp. TaxID=1904252 RepID=UPI003F3E1B66
MTKLNKALGISMLCFAANLAMAAPVATVNGTVIDQAVLDKAVSQIVSANGGRIQDSPALREDVRQRLINRELVLQAANKAGLDKSPEFASRLAEARNDLLQQAFFEAASKNRPVSDADVKAEYDRYASQFKDVKEVQVRQIILADEAAANKAIAALKKGAKFDQMAKAQSLDTASKERGGDLGWGNLAAMEPPLAEALKAIGKGQISAKPLQSQMGWHIFKVEDIRNAQPLAFDSIKARIAQDLQEKAVRDAVLELRQKANIQ